LNFILLAQVAAVHRVRLVVQVAAADTQQVRMQ
jgi:hypothetical protein